MTQLIDLVDAGNAQVSLEDCVEKLEQQLKDKQEQLRKLSQETLPNMMAEVGLASFKLPNGRSIEIKDVVYAKLPEDSYTAFSWLRTKGMDGVIKTQVVLNYGKGDDHKLQAIQEALAQMGEVPVVKSTIHHMTLRALVKEQIEKGSDIPLEAFGAGTLRTAVVKN